MALALVASACLPAAHPAAKDPSIHARYVLAFGGDGTKVVFLERSDADVRTLSLTEIDTERGERREEPLTDAALTSALGMAWPARAELAALIASSTVAAQLGARGYRLAELEEQATLATAYGTLSVSGEAITLRDADLGVSLEHLPPGIAPRALAWLRDPRGDAVALEVSYDSSPAVVSPYVIALRPAAARVAAARAYQAYLREQWDASLGLWRRAVDLDATVGDSHYNLACTAALADHEREALEALGQAIRVGGRDYRELAARDPDFASIAELPEFVALIGAEQR